MTTNSGSGSSSSSTETATDLAAVPLLGVLVMVAVSSLASASWAAETLTVLPVFQLLEFRVSGGEAAAAETVLLPERLRVTVTALPVPGFLSSLTV